jgi:radical SAM protein with 4Fe4S-binding SPASM domain
VNAHFTLMRHNLHELKSFFTLAEELPAESLGVMVMRPSGRAVENSDLLLTKDEYRQAVRSMMEYAASCRKSAHLLPFLPGMDADGPSRLYSGFGCGAARVTCHIDASGNACPCNYFAGDLEKENVLDRGLLTVWAENPFFRRLRNLEGSSQCKSCRHFRDCRGGCRAQAQHFHGLLDAPDYYCM